MSSSVAEQRRMFLDDFPVEDIRVETLRAQYSGGGARGAVAVFAIPNHESCVVHGFRIREDADVTIVAGGLAVHSGRVWRDKVVMQRILSFLCTKQNIVFTVKPVNSDSASLCIMEIIVSTVGAPTRYSLRDRPFFNDCVCFNHCDTSLVTSLVRYADGRMGVETTENQ